MNKVAISKLNKQQREKLWHAIQEHEPALQQVLESDFVQTMRRDYGAQVELDSDVVKRCLQRDG